MSQVKIQGGASGSDNYTILAPATSTGQPEKVVAIAQAAWTPEVIAAYQAAQQ